ncbi:zinc ion binding protein [Trifolium repens]|nr:zinc ion binding protein [Trifolium repens]
MNSDDQYKVWEIRALKSRPEAEQAHKMLEKIAKQVQPIMRKHKWRVKVLSEFYDSYYWGYNVGGGEEIKLHLRRSNRDSNFYPFHEVLDTMLHELCHNVYSRHNAKFYKLWNELRKECGELLAKGITGSGPNRIGGDSFIMKALSPGQAAAMAAERRLQDDLRCGSQSCDPSDHEDVNNESSKNLMNKQNNVGSSRPADNCTLAMDPTSRKRSRDKDSSLPVHSSSNPKFVDLTMDPTSWKRSRDKDSSLPVYSSSNPKFVDLTMDTPKKGCVNEHQSGSHRRSFGLDSQLNTHGGSTSANLLSSSGSLSGDNRIVHFEESALWQCLTCTLLNKSIAPICELCGTQQPKDVTTKHNTWCCKFCTLENSAKLERCSACDEWRYSNGPNLGP